MERVVLVDENNNEIGIEEKMRAHAEGKLHRAFSIFIFDSDEKLLLQKRAQTKYHSGGLWSNTACGHPRPGESITEAARRRLRDEMNFDCEIQEVFSFIYREQFENTLIEHEYDHVFKGQFNGEPVPNAQEVEEYRWISLGELRKDLQRNPDAYTAWLKIAMSQTNLQELIG